MLTEFAFALSSFLVFALIGLPVSVVLWQWKKEELSFGVSSALAPAFGVTLVALVSAPTYMFAGPSENWAWPALLILVSASTWALGALRPWPRFDRSAQVATASLLIALLAVGFCLVAPALGGGFNRVVFNSNPSDTLTYLTLAESTRTASFEQVRSYGQGAAALLQENPLALYSARFVGAFMRLTTFIDLGWLSQVSGIGIERMLWPFAFVMGLVTTSAAWSLARVLHASNIVAALAAAAVTVGFWGAMPRDADAYSHLHSMPLLLAIAALRVIDVRSGRQSIAVAVGVGLILAAFVQVYTELIVVPIAALIAEALARAAVTWKPVAEVRSLGIAMATMVVTLLVTGQAPYILDITVAQYINIVSGNAAGGFVFEQSTRLSPLASIAGFAWLSSFSEPLGVPDWATRGLVRALTFATLIAAVVAGAMTLLRRSDHSIIMVSATAASGVVMAIVALFLRHDIYAFQKAMTSAAPFSLMLLAVMASWRPNGAALVHLARGTGATLLVVQLLFPSVALARDLSGKRPDYMARYHQGRNYELSQLHERLGSECPCDLLVYVTPRQDWWYATYVALSMAKYQPYYQMGFFYDNGPKTVLVSGVRATDSPRYALVHQQDDYIGPAQLGELLYDEGQLRLYRIQVQAPEAFAPRAVSPR